MSAFQSLAEKYLAVLRDERGASEHTLRAVACGCVMAALAVWPVYARFPGRVRGNGADVLLLLSLPGLVLARAVAPHQAVDGHVMLVFLGNLIFYSALVGVVMLLWGRRAK